GREEPARRRARGAAPDLHARARPDRPGAPRGHQVERALFDHRGARQARHDRQSVRAVHGLDGRPRLSECTRSRDRFAHPADAAGLRQARLPRREPHHRHADVSARAHAAKAGCEGAEGRWTMRHAVVVLLCVAAACSHGEERVKTGTADSPQQGTSGIAGVADPGTAPTGAERSGGLTGVAEHPRSRQPVEVDKASQPPQSAASAENVHVLALPATQKPLVTIALRFTSGALDDPRGKAGLTALAARVMAEGGTQALDAKSLLVALFPLATSIDARVDKELTTFVATVHRDNLAKLL